MADEQLKIDVVLRNFASKELKKVEGDIGRFGRAALAPFRALSSAVFSLKGLLAGLGVALTGRALFNLVKGTADEADKIRDLSIELGASTEALSELEFAAKQSGNTLEDLAGGFRILQKAVGEFRLLGTGPLVEVLGRLSPTFREMVQSGAPVEELFQQFSREIRNLGDAERVFVTSKLFGRGSSSLLSTLSEDLDESRRKAKELGLTIGKDAADAADQFNDALGELGGALEGLKRQAILPLLPELKKLVEFMTEGLVKNKPEILGFFADVVEGGGSLAKSFADTAISFEESFGTIGRIATRAEILKLTFQGFVNKFGPQNPVGASADPKLGEQQIREATRLSQELFDGAEARTKTLKALGDTAAASSKSAADRIREMADAQRQFRADLEFVGPLLSDTFEEFGPTLEQLGAGFSEVSDEIRVTGDSLEEMSLKLEAQNEAWLRERDAIYGARAALQDLGNEYNKWGEAAYQAVTRVADALGSNTTDALLEVIEGMKSAKDAFRDFGRAVLKDIARIIIQLLIMKAIEAGAGLGSVFANNIRVNAAVSGAAKGGVFGGHFEPVKGHLQGGGIVRQRGLFELREGGRNEAVVPLPDNQSIPVELRGRGGQTINQTINVTFVSQAKTSAQEQAMLRENARTIAAVVASELKQNAAFRETMRAA